MIHINKCILQLHLIHSLSTRKLIVNSQASTISVDAEVISVPVYNPNYLLFVLKKVTKIKKVEVAHISE